MTCMTSNGDSPSESQLSVFSRVPKRRLLETMRLLLNPFNPVLVPTLEQALVFRSISYVPGLYKIFDEILVNAADNKQRDPSMDSVKVEINIQQNMISVYNNGDGVPVEIHGEEGVYVPEMIFGHLLTSSNYDDTQKKTTGGRNGYGAKLANIFSTEFTIETADGKRLRRYKQVSMPTLICKYKMEVCFSILR